jgi:hypothetical protein
VGQSEKDFGACLNVNDINAFLDEQRRAINEKFKGTTSCCVYFRFCFVFIAIFLSFFCEYLDLSVCNTLGPNSDLRAQLPEVGSAGIISLQEGVSRSTVQQFILILILSLFSFGPSFFSGS